jgi:transcriptional antiterminator RfaH
VHWYVAYTQPQKEMVAQHHLVEQGFDVYLPRFKKVRRHARKVDMVLAPLFPRYLFFKPTDANQQWRSVNGTRGVAMVLMQDNQPSVVSSVLISAMQREEDADGLLSVQSLTNFVRGEKVRITDGAFRELEAVFEEMDDQQRVQILLTFLGRETRLKIPAYAVERI